MHKYGWIQEINSFLLDWTGHLSIPNAVHQGKCGGRSRHGPTPKSAHDKLNERFTIILYLHVYPIKKGLVILLQIVMGRVVQTWIKITQGKCKIWIQIWKLKSRFSLILSVNTVDDWMLLKITEKVFRENALNKR